MIKLILSILFLIISFLSGLQSQQLPPGYCPSPLIYHNSTNRELDAERGYQWVGTTHCVQPCPSIIFSENQWNLFLNVSLYAGGVSLFCSMFLIITYSPLVLHYKKHTRHTISILFLFVGIFLMNTTNGRVFWDQDKSGFNGMCPEKGRFARGQFDKYCLATGLFFQFGCLTAAMWWSTLSMDIYLTIKKFKISDKQILYYTVAVNSIAILLTFIPIASNQYGQSAFNIGCWVLSLDYQIYGFWLWIGLCLLAGSVFIGLIIFEIYKTSGAVKKKLLARHLKPLILCSLLLFHFFYMFIFVGNLMRNRGKYTQDITEYITCILINAGKPNSDELCKIKRGINVGAQFTYFLFSRLMGFESVLFYGITNQTIKIWRRSFWLNNKLVSRFTSSLSSSTIGNTSGTVQNSAIISTNSSGIDRETQSHIDEENYENSLNKSIELK